MKSKFLATVTAAIIILGLFGSALVKKAEADLAGDGCALVEAGVVIYNYDASSIGRHSATLNGYVGGSGGVGPQRFWFDYWTGSYTSHESTPEEEWAEGGGQGPYFSMSISGLKAGKTYNHTLLNLGGPCSGAHSNGDPPHPPYTYPAYTMWAGPLTFTTLPPICAINSFTADDTNISAGASTTLRYSFSDAETGETDVSVPWSISLLSGSVNPSPSSGTASPSGSSSTGNLTGTQTYRLTCGSATRDVTINVAASTYTLTVGQAGSGTGTVSGGGTYPANTNQNAYATPTGSSIFSGWSGNCNGSTSPYTVYMDSDKTCTATFNPPSPSQPPTGSLSSPSCTISAGQSTCSTNINWSIQNSTGNPIIISGEDNFISVSGSSGTVTIPYGSPVSQHFYLYSGYGRANCPNPITSASMPCQYGPITSSTGSATCGSGTWNGTICSTSPLQCSPISGTTETRTTTPCPVGQTGVITETRTMGPYSACVWGAWTVTSNTCATLPAMSASLTASDCRVDAGQSSCLSNISWSSTTNPQGITTVKTPVDITVGTPSNNGGAATYPVSLLSPENGSRNFYLYNNGVLLDSDTATATCFNSTWNGTTCEAPPGSPSGNLSAASCTIPNNQSTCPISVTWNNFSNLTVGAPTVVTRDNPTVTVWSDASYISGENLNGANTTSLPYSVNLPNGGYTFHLYHSGSEISSPAFATATCSPGVWVPAQNKCMSPTGPSGHISANDCTIDAGASICSNINVTWSTSGTTQETTTEVTKNNLIPPQTTHVAFGTSGGPLDVAVKHESKGLTTFYLFNSASIPALASVDVKGRCAQGTSWDGTKCDTTTGGTYGECSSPPAHYNCIYPPGVNTGTNQSDDGINYTWICRGSDTAHNVSCTEPHTGPPQPIDGHCTTPLNHLSASRCVSPPGISSPVTSNISTWVWVCAGQNGGQPMTCIQNKPKPVIIED